MEKKKTDDSQLLLSDAGEKTEGVQENTNTTEEHVLPHCSTGKDFGTSVVVKQEIIEEFEMKTEPIENKDGQELNTENVIKQEVVWLNEVKVEEDDEDEQMEKDCLDGEGTSNTDGTDFRDCPSSSISLVEQRKKFACFKKNTQVTEERQEECGTTDLGNHILCVCDNCGCEACECSVNQNCQQEVERKLYSCTHCDFNTPYDVVFKRHITFHKKKPHSCTECKYRTSHSYQMKLHMMTHIGMEPQSSTQSGDKAEELKTSRNRESPSFSCPICKFMTTDIQDFNVHVFTHQQQQREHFFCPLVKHCCTECEFKTMNKKDLIKHMKAHNVKCCDQCDYKTETKGDLLNHLKIHKEPQSKGPQGPYLCDECGFVAKWPNILKTHKRTHTGEKPFACTYCEFRTSRRTWLTSHIRIHTGEKPYSCKLCGFRTNRRTYMYRHEKTHREEKPYSCDWCEYKSTTKHNLKTHIRTHSGEKPFSCNQCEYRASHNCSLKTHVEKAHGGNKE